MVIHEENQDLFIRWIEILSKMVMHCAHALMTKVQNDVDLLLANVAVGQDL